LNFEHTDIEESLPTETISSVYPNPFNSTTTIHYKLAQAGSVKINVLMLLGSVCLHIVQANKILEPMIIFSNQVA